MERRQDIVRSAHALVQFLKLNKNGLHWTLRVASRSTQIVCPLKLIFQHHLAINFERFATFAAGFQVESLLHHVGVVESFSFKGILLARRHGIPERHKCPLAGILFSECQTFSFRSNDCLCLFLGFFGLLAFLSPDGAFEAGW